MPDGQTIDIASANGLLVAEDDGSSVLLANLDTANTIYLGTTNAFGTSPGSSDSVPLSPQASMVADGSEPWYAAIAAGQTAQLAVIPGGTQFNNPVGVQIALSKLGLATASNQGTQIAAANNTNNVLNSGIALPIGAAVETGGNLAQAASQLALGIAGNPLAKTADVVTTLPANIATTGVPLLTQPNTLIANTNTNVNGTVTLGPFNVNQIAYEGFFSTNAVASGPNYLEYALSWFDAGGSLVAGDRGFIIGGTSPTHTVFIKGPTKGDSVTVTLVTSVAFTVNHALFQTSRVHARNEWRSLSFGSLGVLPIPGDPLSGVLASWATGSIASGAQVTAMLPLWNGKVRGSVATFSGSDILTITVNDNGNVGLVTPAIFEAEIAAGTDSSFEMNLPYDNCTMVVKNTGATAVSPTISLVAEEY